MRLKIILAHIYADDNKGDLGIIYATLIGLRHVLDEAGYLGDVYVLAGGDHSRAATSLPEVYGGWDFWIIGWPKISRRTIDIAESSESY